MSATPALPSQQLQPPQPPSGPASAPVLDACLQGCDLPAAWAQQAQWRVLDTDWGQGLRFLHTWTAWRADPLRPRLLHYVAVMDDTQTALAALSALATQAAPLAEGLAGGLDRPASAEIQTLARELLQQCWGLLPGVHRLSLERGQVQLTLWIGAAPQMLRSQHGEADSVFLSVSAHTSTTSSTPTTATEDSAPSILNPDALKAVARHCRRGTRLAALVGAPSQPAAGEQLPQKLIQQLAQQLTRLGFEVAKTSPPTATTNSATANTASTCLQACFNPRWQPRQRADVLVQAALAGTAGAATASRCLVLGAGLAGAAAAASLARRGWQVTVMDAAGHSAAGASGLPAGLFCPHVSPDDSLISRLSRSGVRTTLQNLQQLTQAGLLQPGVDWAHEGVLEHDVEQPAHLPPSWLQSIDNTSIDPPRTDSPRTDTTSTGGDPVHPGLHWSRPASAAQLQAAQLPADSHALWHVQAGWVRPARLVQALLHSAGARWHGSAAVARLQPLDAAAPAASTDSTACANSAAPAQIPRPARVWQALDAQGQLLAEADLVVIALGPDSTALMAASGLPAAQWQLQAIRGQVSVAAHDAQTLAAMPPFAINGHGNLVPNFPAEGSASDGTSQPTPHWVMGSSFERDVRELPPSPADQAAAHASNADKLAALAPAARQGLQGFFGRSDLPPTWARVRCAAYDRIPVVGPLAVPAEGAAPEALPHADASLWVLTGLGSRGLSLSLLCAELMAAQLHGEPLPLDARLAQALGTARLDARAGRSARLAR